MPEYDLNDMAIFAKVVEHQGFSAASRAIGLPKSNISRRVTRLEEQLGIRLLERTPRQLHLTEIGELFVRHCRRILEEVESAEHSVSHMLEKPRGQLRVSVSVTTGQQLISPLVGEYLKQYSEVQVQLILTNRRVDIIEEGIDVAIRIGKLDDSNLLAKRLGESSYHLYASPSYLGQIGHPKHPSELSQYTFLAMEDLSSPTRLKFLGSSGEVNIKMKPRACINDFNSLRCLVRQGLGIAILPAYMKLDSDKDLTCLLPEWNLPTVDFHALYPSIRGATPKVRTFLNFLEKHLPGLL